MPGTKKSRSVPHLSVSETEVKITGQSEQEGDLEIRGTFSGKILLGDLIVQAEGATIDGQFSVRALTMVRTGKARKQRTRKNAPADAETEGSDTLPPFLIVRHGSSPGLPEADLIGETTSAVTSPTAKRKQTARFDFV
ncbi:hypothetical protein AMJ71_09095 [candidate division TA06 bacterium SM1_40]|jgi:hypothetical protein|uniref:Polymer-forming cytoskeletal protein n=1 Tax=candidate division TA06 bacterium SM1_40 TaxID=1703773 RepID=A0A0S8JCG4_UNCT6|nr:MAG: hypothetical protein AMJ71_09095 [candidate division TA06 bacterium SM1_40]